MPNEEDEDRRQLHREVETLKKEKAQHRLRIQSLLFTQGIDVKVGQLFLKKLEGLRSPSGKSVPAEMKRRVEREYDRLQLVEAQLREIRKQQTEQVRAVKQDAVMEKVRKLQQLTGIGMGSSWVFVMELFGWRQFQNRRQLAAAIGLTPTPYNSGDSVREQGISRAGNRRVRKLAIELAWCWLRFQPQSQLSQWYKTRFGGGGARMRRIGIVAMARRLMIDLWRYVEFETIPTGARLRKSAAIENA